MNRDQLDAAIVRVQELYPRIFHACHVDHVRRKSNAHRLSPSDSAILAHIGAGRAIGAAELARHLGVTKSTLSAALARLTALGYLAQEADPRDRRKKSIRLLERGVAAMSATSVLDARRLRRVLARRRPDELQRAVAGLALIADRAAAVPTAWRTRRRAKPRPPEVTP